MYLQQLNKTSKTAYTGKVIHIIIWGQVGAGLFQAQGSSPVSLLLLNPKLNNG
jgi:hypothetical protein